VDIRDTKLAGFVLRVRPSGQHTYFVNYKRGGWTKIGTTAVLDAPEARERARDILADVTKGADPQADKRAAEAQAATEAAAEAARSPLFDTFIAEHYEPWATAQRKTGAEQAARLRSVFGPVLKGRRLDEITPFEIERWRSARLKAEITPETVNRDLNTLRGALSKAVEWGKLAAHPLKGVKATKTDTRKRVRYLSDAERARLLKALTTRDEMRRAERDRANRWRAERSYPRWPPYGTFTDHLTPLVLLALHTGLRRGELFSLTWRDVDLVKALVTVRGETAKSEQTRYIPLNATAAATLATWREITGAEAAGALVFPGDEGKPLTDIKSAWRALMTSATIIGFRFHDCRHDFASRLVMKGIDLNTVRELLGHGDLKMTVRYSHLAPEHKAAAVAKLVNEG
jgi:integrase